jgi:hypothetical protein
MVRQLVEAFFAYPHVVALVLSVGLAGALMIGFWMMRATAAGAAGARVALRAQALRGQKDHRALVLIASIDGGGKLREELQTAIEQHFGQYAFQAPVQVELFPTRLEVLKDNAPLERRRRVAAEAADLLERTFADVVVWGVKSLGGKVDLRICTPPAPTMMPDVGAISFKWNARRGLDALGEAIAFICARRARPVLNKPQDYKPEKLQPIVEALDRLVNDPPETLNDAARMEILSDFASGALSLGERGGEAGWLVKALDARRQYLERVDRTSDAAAWGRAQQEVGRALAALGEREADRAKLEESVQVLKVALDALRATENLQSAEVAMRALSRAEQTLAQRKRIGLRWPV